MTSADAPEQPMYPPSGAPGRPPADLPVEWLHPSGWWWNGETWIAPEPPVPQPIPYSPQQAQRAKRKKSDNLTRPNALKPPAATEFVDAAQPPTGIEPERPRLKLPKRRLAAFAGGTAAALLLVVFFVGRASVSTQGAALKTATGQVSNLLAENSQLTQGRDAARAEVDQQAQTVAEAKQTAANAVAVARNGLQSQYAGQAQQLNDRSSQLDQREAAVSKREQAVQVAEQGLKATFFSGDGLYLVGHDIQPGIYQTPGADANGNCYFARLASTDTNNIVDNGNYTGQVTITVLPSDVAVTVTGCQPFKKIG